MFDTYKFHGIRKWWIIEIKNWIINCRRNAKSAKGLSVKFLTRAHCILLPPTITPVYWRPSLTLKDHPRLLLEHLRKEGFFVKPSLPSSEALKPHDFSKKIKIRREEKVEARNFAKYHSSTSLPSQQQNLTFFFFQTLSLAEERSYVLLLRSCIFSSCWKQ